jgi:hypothetical protein
MEAVKIVLLCIVSAVLYGIMHDQVTARVCVEYFTMGHPPVFHTDSPTVLALGWGVIATWWMGLLLGIPTAIASRCGSWPKYTANLLIRPIGVLLGVMGVASFIAGMSGYLVAKGGGVELLEPLRSQVPESKHAAFLADLWAHLTAYGVGFLGGLTICGWVLCQRYRLALKINPDHRQIDFRRAMNQIGQLCIAMRYRFTTLLLLAVIAGLFWRLASGLQLAVAHVIAPPLFGLLVAYLFRTLSLKQQLLILIITLAASEIVRLITYCVVANGWRYISSDGETQAVILLSFTVQFVIAGVVWLVARSIIRRVGTVVDAPRKIADVAVPDPN